MRGTSGEWDATIGGWVVVTVGSLVIGGIIWYGFTFNIITYRSPIVTLLDVASLLLMTTFGFAVIRAGLGYLTTETEAIVSKRAAIWCCAAYVGAHLIVGLLLTHVSIAATVLPSRFVAQQILTFSGGGAFSGVILGHYEGRLRHRTDQVTAQRNALTVANEFLRHHVLNGMQVVLGYTELVANGETTRASDATRLDTVKDRSESIVDLVQRIGYLMRSLSDETTLGPVSLSDVLTEEIETAEATHPHLTVHANLERASFVYADTLLSVVFEELLANAVEHANGGDPVEVTVGVTRQSDRVHVRVEDDGQGIDTAERDSLFTPGESSPREVGRGFGLYLSAQLVQRYGGSLELDDESDDGSGAAFVVSLPVANTDGLAPVTE